MVGSFISAFMVYLHVVLNAVRLVGPSSNHKSVQLARLCSQINSQAFLFCTFFDLFLSPRFTDLSSHLHSLFYTLN
jgi:hypothetical protein